MAGYEWKKLLGRRRLWLVLAVLAAELLSLVFFTRPYDRDLEENRPAYEAYLAQVMGPLTPEKRERLESEMKRLSQADRDMESLKMAYYSGALTEADYRAQFEALYPDCQRYPSFAKLYSQYIYVREDPARRYFLYTGGWEVLLGDQQPDYLLLLTLILLLPTLFCEEYASGMSTLLLTQKRSAARLPLVKVSLAVLLAASLAGVSQLLRLACCALRFGLPGGAFPLQSLVSFGGAEKSLSLWQGYWLQFFLRELGYVYAALLILALASGLKKYALTMMASVVLLILPFFTVSEYSLLLPIPAPWALTLGSIYLNGSISHTDRETGEKVLRVAELSGPRLALFIAGILVIQALLAWFIWRKNANAHLKKRWRRALPVLAALCLLTGCGGQEERVCWNYSAPEVYSTEDWTVMGNSARAWRVDNPSGLARTFPLDAFTDTTVLPPFAFFGTGEEVYYWKETRLGVDEFGSGGLTGSLSLVRGELSTGVETVVRQFGTEDTWFFGLLQKPPSDVGYWRGSFFLYRGDLFVRENETLYRLGKASRQRERYLDHLGLDLAFDGTRLYYTDRFNRLVIHSLETGAETPLETVIASHFCLTPEGIFYLNIREKNSLYRYDTASGETERISDLSGWRLADGGEAIWLFGSDALCRIPKNGGEAAQVPLDRLPMGEILVPRHGSWIFALDSQGEILGRMDKSTLEWEKE